MGCHSFSWWGLVYAVSFPLYLAAFSFFEAMESVIGLLYVKYTLLHSFSCTSYLCVVYHVDEFHFTSLDLVNCCLYVEFI